MTFNEYFINNRSFTFHSPLVEALELEANKNYLFDLSYLSSLAIRGERAQEFLQGQLTCDVHQVTLNSMRQGALCNLKGRILALLDVIYWEGFQLILPLDLMTDTQTSLAKAAMLSRVAIEPSASYQIYGFYMQNPHDLLPASLTFSSERYTLSTNEHACCYYLGDQSYCILIQKKDVFSLTQPFMNHQQMRGSLAWHQLQLQHQRVLIYPETRGLFLTHRLDLRSSGYISFDKGCYKGQDIIARTHYRAKLKHGLQLATIETNEPLLPGKRLFDPAKHHEIGELVDFSPLGECHYLIAMSILLEHPTTVLIEDHLTPVFLAPC